MHVPDLINGAFETLGGVSAWGNVRRIRADKMVKGVDWRFTLFFSLWGIWNLYYYPSLDQWASFAGGLVIVLGNVAWVYFALKYRSNK
jgi:hypothetical protein